MPEEKEKIEDFITLWKNKTSQENDQPSIIGETMSQLETLKNENDELRRKISEDIELISKSEEVIKKLSTDRERMRIENEESIMEITMRVNNLEKENIELGNKVKSMVKLLMDKDDELKKLSDQLTPEDSIINKELQNELSKKNERIELLNKKISEMKSENENLQAQFAEKLESMAIIPEPEQEPKDKVLKPLPPETSTQPLELLCQDLQADLNKYKKIIEKLNQEKSQLTQALEGGSLNLNDEELRSLKSENEALRNDLLQLQNSMSKAAQSTTNDQSPIIAELQEKLVEKENIIAEFNQSQQIPLSTPKGPITDLIKELQNNINKLKHTIQEKDQEILELKKILNP